MKEVLHCFHGEQSFFHFRWNSQAEGMFQDGLGGQKWPRPKRKKEKIQEINFTGKKLPYGRKIRFPSLGKFFPTSFPRVGFFVFSFPREVFSLTFFGRVLLEMGGNGRCMCF